MTDTQTIARTAIETLGSHEKDTGSSAVQVGILTAKIKALTEHMKTHKKDFRSQRSLRIFVSQRTRHLTYLKRTNPVRYQEVVATLGLRK